MSSSTTARARTARTPASRTHAPRAPRRVSGPVGRPVAARAAVAVPQPTRRATGAFDRVRALPDHRVVDGLLRSQAWIWLIGIALGGIVAMQVSLLKLNTGISRAVESASTLERQNAALESSVARLSAGQRIGDAASAAGMVMPPAGKVDYVRVRPGTDARWAETRMTAPTEEARALMANGGIVPGSLIAPAEGIAPAAAVTPATAAAPATTTATATPPAENVVPPAETQTTAPAQTTTPPPATPATPGAAAAPATTQGQG